MAVNLPRNRVAVVSKQNHIMWYEGVDFDSDRHSGVELIVMTLWWVHVFIPLLFFSATGIRLLKVTLSSINFWNS